MVNANEAEQVRQIFDIAAEATSLETVLAQLAARGYQTKAWSSKAGVRIQRGPSAG